MKQQTKETLKIVIGILIGMAVVMGVMGFMLTMLWHIFVIPVLVGLFIASGGLLIAFMGRKGIIVVVGSFVFGLWGFNTYYNYACGPNSADVKVMKPMAEKISDYIVKHGIPESLQDIPDLPYKLEGCERKVEYSKFNKKLFKYVKVKENATSKTVSEKCNFFKNNRKYYLDSRALFELKKNIGGISINIGNKKSETWDIMYFNMEKNNNIFSDNKINFGSSKSSGICKPWRQ